MAEQSQWGTLVPMTSATNETNEKMSRDKCMPISFLAQQQLPAKRVQLRTKEGAIWVALTAMGEGRYTMSSEDKQQSDNVLGSGIRTGTVQGKQH